jgi:hypothetical protein
MRVTGNAPAKLWRAPLVSFSIALVVLVCATLAWGPARKVDPGDSEQYLAIGRSLANGRGYIDTAGLWPDRPSYDRMPGWPLVIAAALKLAPQASEAAVLRYTGAFCLALIGAFFALLHRQLGVRSELSVLGGLAVALSPGMVFLALAGLSEVLFLLVAAAGTVAILGGGRWMYAGAAVFGLAALVRPNFVLMPVAFVLLALLLPGSRGEFCEKMLRGKTGVRLAVLVVIVFLPALAWTLRNYSLTGRFPVLSSLEGETLYGANNEVVANNLTAWGYWIVPDQIPGEMHKADLARGRTDMDLTDYYHHRAIEWIKHHLSALPRLLLGKLIRAFVPMPWLPVAGTWLAFSYRFLLDVLYLSLVRWWWPEISRLYLLLCLAMLLVLLFTTVLYYGSFRFTHVSLEVFFVPCICVGLQSWHDSHQHQRAA